MVMHLPEEMAPTFYGSVTVGERGQVVIPADARRDLEIAPSTKLLVFGNPQGGGLIITKAESITRLLTRVTGMLTRLDETLKADKALTHEQD